MSAAVLSKAIPADARRSWGDGSGLLPGTYRVFVVGPRMFETVYQVSESARFDIDITGASVQGRTVDATTKAAVAGVEVSFSVAGEGGRSSRESATSDDDGAFHIPALHPGLYRLVTRKTGFGQQVR